MSENFFPIVSNPEGTNPEKTAPQSNGSLPRNVLDTIETSERVSPMWRASGWKLLHCTYDELDAKTADLKAADNQQSSEKSARTPITFRKSELKKELTEAYAAIKSYCRISKGYSGGLSILGEFGFVHDKNGYNFPQTDTEFVKALGQMEAGCQKYGFTGREYGTEYWTGIRNEFSVLYAASTGAAQTMAKKSVDKIKLKAEIVAVLKSIRLLIEANYPGPEYEKMLRAWGFLKEKY